MTIFKSSLLLLVLLTANLLFAQSDFDVVSLNVNNNNIEAAGGDEFTVTLIADIKSGWHINSNTPNDEFLLPSEVTAEGEGIELVNVKYPEPLTLTMEFSDKPVSAYEGKVEIPVTFRVEENADAAAQTMEITLGYQACNDKTCMPPNDVSVDVEVNITAPAVKEAPVEEPAEVEPVKEKIIEEKPDEIEKPVPEETVEDSSLSQKKMYSISDTVNVAAQEEVKSESTGLILALLFAFIGGLILNLMPCVLPVLSLKIMGIVEQAGEAQKEKLKHGLLFTLGVLVSFWILAGLLLILRAGGEQLGWGFQLQSPGFVIVLSIFIFLFGMSMFGVFEIGTTLTSVQGGKSKSGYMSSFTSGVLATIVATPCTAPFMGSALGFAISQPFYVSLLVFTFLGLGMAAPYLILTTTPKLLKFIPKPGLWMETMKQFMGFLLMATVLWLLWVLGLQTGVDGVMIVLASLIFVSIAGWVYGRWGNIAKAKKVRRIAQVISGLTIIAALAFALQNVEVKAAGTDTAYKQGTIEWQKFNPELVEQLRSENKPVFIDFTAAWCLSCQVNEKVAFSSEEVQKAFADKEIVTLKGDWTNKDETITKALAEFGRNSVPFYVLYVPGNSEPVILPEILTPDIVLDRLDLID